MYTTHPRTRARAALTAAAALFAAAPAAANAETAAAKPADVEIILDIAAGEPIMLADKEQKAYVKIALTGFDLPTAARRAPINLALVLDRSSSMSGDKFEKAKQAALLVLDRLGPEDILSVITYDSTVEVLVPATKVRERDAIRERISSLGPRGATALFAGVSHGIDEVSKFLDGTRVNRVILLSDGQANVGPSSPNELGRLGEAAGKRGISITSIGLGLGYNEDLMTQLAMQSDGNHGFAETGDDLVTLFNYELGDVLSVVAQDVDIEIEFDRGVRPLRALGRDIEIHGNRAVLSLNQLYSKQEKYVLMEVAVPATAAGATRDLAKVAVGYQNIVTGKRQRVGKELRVSFSGSAKDVAKSENRNVMVSAVEAVAAQRNREALALRDQGQIDQAESVLRDNAAELDRQSKKYKSERLKSYSETNSADAAGVRAQDWNKQRKAMRKEQHRIQTNQSY